MAIIPALIDVIKVPELPTAPIVSGDLVVHSNGSGTLFQNGVDDLAAYIGEGLIPTPSNESFIIL